ncbi:DUF883 family protein [Caldimonas thermodepolymerans]|uniref:DUF883 domain-containing protein n=1 Tax=Caldimonas thermodepolymerans TaxID=215580 RepID=A0A2S5T4N4_9BURK|nr:DUF883 family protein [Caldimonas thermodepolymerans]PPE69941.1 DUF883 domain-containing protein [Caldimonas thermodepolymerans]QPC31673.1 DUF883 family protein [Caldimonas thermodepolymerans]RDH94869.1 ElaB/YqjD/DUF883 family membrane-anchored ribosome-binding protein [Caldimonas thermodepolymerans]TCP02776.1 ElaB/YqjD/DUF883 family membrane-anchored ribosome-binding protein [Caldimonas thermodepolymerans]UZG44455.1 DUF883 family protein [Caldimonas thermodepolymerans]
MDTRMRKERLTADMKLVARDMESLLRSAARQANGEMQEQYERLLDRLAETRQQLGEVEDRLAGRVRAAGRATDGYVHEHPWQVIGVAAAVGALVGAALVGLRR